jgi:hypothetical protein
LSTLERSVWYKGAVTAQLGCDTAFFAEDRRHRFLNQSKTEMAMVWVYAGTVPGRKLVDAAYCSGSLSGPAQSS